MNTMEKQYHIFHTTEAKFSFTETEVQPRQYVGYVEADSLEKAFEYAQNDHVDWCFNETRSTSVGDVIQADDGFYMVCGTGFRLLDEQSKNESDLNGLENSTYEG